MRTKLMLAVLSLMVLAWTWYGQSSPPVKTAKDVIKFSHNYHMNEVGTACVDCHEQVTESKVATDNLLPEMAVCANCHDVEDENACTTCHYEDEATWQPFPHAEADLKFNHAFHINELKMECTTCHQDVAEVDYGASAEHPLMSDCTQCHDNEQAPMECAFCHTNTLTLRPVDHTADFLIAHKNLARLDEEECAVCHTQNDCAECHEGATMFTTAAGSNNNVQTLLLPSVGGGTKGLLISRVHDLNFRATHALQAVGRTEECAVCHETQGFCQTCHEAEGVAVAGKPIWHGGADWGALAGVVGTGGGRHAELAKRDIETCAACHSTQGDDPTCLLCHTDFDGVQGTNPKTHESGFANRFGEDSSFHDDQAALCYSCHTNSQQAGFGFCGYCHGPEVN